jgi:hypothetical protein
VVRVIGNSVTRLTLLAGFEKIECVSGCRVVRVTPRVKRTRSGAADLRRAGDTTPTRRSLSPSAKSPQPYRSRIPCPSCHTVEAYLVHKRGQATVRCARCHSFRYNAPHTETGAKPRTVTTLRRPIRPAQQARILDRDHGRCILCGTTEELTIGHLLSVEDAARLGVSTSVLYSDANLAAMCEGCNAGLRHGPKSINPRTYACVMWRLVQVETRGVATDPDHP